MRDLSVGIVQSLGQLYDELVSFDARKLGMEFELPFFIVQGDTQFLDELVRHVRPLARSK
jgi:hypothetical protein